MIKNYIDAINNIKFSENLKEKILINISEKSSKKFEFFPKTLISLAGIQMILYIFSTTCAAYII